MELTQDLPSRLVPRLRRGELDAALVSSIEAFRWPGYRVLASLGIASRGAVRSVRAFRRRGAPIRTVGLDESSETSVALLKILLARRLGARSCSFTTIAPTLEPAALPQDLVLLIGDHGLRAAAGDREVLDLGQLWHEWTALPFVFALWLLGPHADARAVVARLAQARREEPARGIRDGTGGAIRYELGATELQGLWRFRDEAVALQLADPAVEPAFLNDSMDEADAQPQ